MPARSGGYGLYYHFDYVGGGRNYKWVDTVNLDQHLGAAEPRLPARGVGPALGGQRGRPEERGAAPAVLPRLRVEPGRVPLDRLGDWERQYAAQNFGPEHAPAIADVLTSTAVCSPAASRSCSTAGSPWTRPRPARSARTTTR